MKTPQVTDLSDANAKDALVGVNAKTAANLGAGWWDRRVDADGVSRGTKGRRRLLAAKDTPSYYHAMSRTVGGEIFFDDVEKEALKTLIWKLARFCKIRVLTYAVMGNHFHVLLEIPDKEKITEEFSGPEGEERLLTHVGCLYSKSAVASLRSELKRLREQERHSDAAAVIDSIITRMADLSRYMKEVKERFTRWYNKRRGRKGTLWMDRFKSVIVGNGEALRTMALYIDLNPVRAGIVKDPADYRWCGWGEALGGSRRAKRGTCRIMECAVDSWEQGKPNARTNYKAALESILDGERINTPSGDASPTPVAKSSDSSPKTTTESKAKPSSELRSLLLHRVRYFTDGAVIGSKRFVESIFEANRKQFPEGRSYSSQPFRDTKEPTRRGKTGLHSLKDLRIDIYRQ